MPPRIRLPRTVRQRRAALLVVVVLAAFVGAVFVVVVLGGGILLGRTDTPHPALPIVATVLVALAFDPLQRRLHRWASRVTHGGAQSPYEVLTSLSQPVARAVAAEEVPARIAEVLATGTGARSAQVWLVVGGSLMPPVTWPPQADPAASPAKPSTGAAAAPLATGGDRRSAGGRAVRTWEVRHAGDLLAVLALQERDEQPLTAAQERLVEGLAAQAGLLLHGARLRAERSRRLQELADRAEELERSRRRLVGARDEERRRLERDLHDGAQQHLVALAVNLRLAQAVAATSRSRAAELLSAQAAAARQTVETVLSLARGVYPSTLGDEGLPAALEAAARNSPVAVALDARGVGRYAPDVEAAVYFATLEALQNAAKHSGATRVLVRLAGEPDRLDVTVDDDGRGLPPGPVPAGAGLANMRDRIDAVGGQVHLGPAPGGGVRVTLSVADPRHGAV